ncbi:1-deoxy-D-xylulose-5-phosphate reductoisomerase [Nakamurella antarctica]|uniref:1-deoxy-D-xylulose 5-phosphate reductoisomerase n=1 Tax=Nakamurella antarctica TaxID=1902245 RepID=A0A3G8ZYU3_9ACTN|nr:1-deoxy-D-xylulose-5-phosphate reductoisomerase [Nakamurella antarctica]
MRFPRKVLILGCTGSIGTQALEVVRANPDLFEVTGLAAGGSNLSLFREQALEFPAAQLALATEGSELGLGDRRVRSGPRAATELVEEVDADVVLNGITGSIGLGPTLAALAAGRVLALANKESLVAGGSLVTRAAAPGQIVPVDSEHSALAQALRGGGKHEVAALVLTASGGPFRGKTRAELAEVTAAQALRHPTWAMGPVVTVNSATLVNKGLELIEAHLLFDIPYDRIQTVVHPQSVVHSMVTFADGSTLAQASPPDMKLPIALGLAWPHRVPGAAAACDFTKAASWTFEPVDHVTFPALKLAARAGQIGGHAPAVMNAANEEFVAAFLAGKLAFLHITDQLERILDRMPADFTSEPETMASIAEAEDWSRQQAASLMGC